MGKMKGVLDLQYLKQIMLIVLFSFLGELLHSLIPWPIPASIYGMVLLAAALLLKIIRPRQVSDAGHFLTGILPLLFVAPLVNLVDCWDTLKPYLLGVVIVLVVSSLLTFGAAGLVTQLLMKKGGEAKK